MAQSDLQPVSFLTLERGTSVVDRFGRPVGTVERVLVLPGDGFDGIILRTDAGRRFVDAPEVRRLSGGVVTLGVTRSDVEEPGPNCSRCYGMPVARYDRTDVTEADRDEVIEALKLAYVQDLLEIDELGDRVAIAHTAETLEELDAALGDGSGP